MRIVLAFIQRVFVAALGAEYFWLEESPDGSAASIPQIYEPAAPFVGSAHFSIILTTVSL